MPVYEYQGAHYELADGLSNEQAIQKIKGHLGQGSKQQDQLSSQLGKMGEGISAGVGELGGALKDIAGMFLKPGTKPQSLSGEILQGGAETAATLATGFPAGAAGLVPGGIQSLVNMSKGEAPNFEKNYAQGMDVLTYAPRTEFGQEGAKAAGEFVNRNLIGLGPMIMGSAGAIQRAANANVGMRAFKEKAAAKPQAKVDGRPNTKNIVAQLEEKAAASEKTSSSSADRPQQYADPLDLGHLTKPKIEEVAIDRINRDLPEPMSVMARELEQQGAVERAGQADTLAAERQAQMEFDVKKQATLERGAADLARPDTLTPRVRATEAIDNHPFVRKAEERLVKQEELVTKLSEQVQKGKAQATQLARAVKDLENFETAVARTRENVGKGLSEKTQPVPFGFDRNASGSKAPFNFKRQGGAVNPEVFKEGFQKLKQLADGTWLRAYGDGQFMHVEATKDGHIVGKTTFDGKFVDRAKSDERTLESLSTKVKSEQQGKGIATDMYKFATELGNDVRASSIQSPEGTAMWRGFEKKGFARDGYIPKKQRGAVLIDPNQAPQGKFLSENAALKLPTIVPMLHSPEKIIEMARTAPDVDQNFLQKAINYATKGGFYQALKTDNVVVKYAQERVHDRERAARGEIQRQVHDKLAPASRDMPIRDAAEIWAVVDQADRLKTPVTEEMLRTNGFNEKQIHYWKTHTEVVGENSLKNLNNARRVLGRDPVTARAAYASMSMTGDYRRRVYKLDENGEKVTVGAIGSDWRALTNHRTNKLKEAGYIIGEEQYYGGVPKQRGSAQQAFMEALEVLSDRDPRVADFLDVLQDIRQQEAYNFLNMKKHTLNKKGIFGMEGRKGEESKLFPWTKLAEMNAREGMQSQINYAEAAIKWGHIAEAARDIQTVINDPGINMPHAKRWAEEYLQNAMGFNPSKMGSFIEAGVAEGFGFTGMGYSNVRGGAAAAKKITNTVLLGLNPGFWTINSVQLLANTPGLKASLIAKGLDANFDFGTGYSYVYQGTRTALKKAENLSEFEKGLHRYAKDNHVYGSDLIEHSNRARKDAIYYTDKVGNAVAGNIESVSRRVAFFTWAHMLHENGLSVKNGLYQAAHNLTDMAMNNYSMTERPKMYNSMGPIGELATNLQSYKHGEFSRIAHFARQVKDDKSMRPILVQLAAGIVFAGISGTVAFSELDWLYRQVTKAAGKPDSLTLRVMELSEKAAKKAGVTGNGKYALSHGIFSLAGWDMSKRMGLGNAIGDSAFDIAFPGGSKLVDIAGAAGTAVTNPTEMNAKRLAREVAPGAVTGPMDLEWFSKDTPQGSMGLNRRTMEAQTIRTPGDVRAKKFGFTGISESVEKEKLFQTKAIKEAYADLRKKPLAKARDEMATSGRVSNETVQKYRSYEGDIKTLMADISRMAKDQNIPAKDRELLRATMSKSITSLRHAQRLQEAYKP